MADDEERIRRCVREELVLNLVSSTRNLIHSAASSSVPELNNVFAGQTAQRSSFGSSSPAVISTDCKKTKHSWPPSCGTFTDRDTERNSKRL